MPPILTGLPLSVTALATSPMTEKMLDGITVGFDESVTVKTLDGMTVGLEERITVGFEDSKTMLLTAEDNATVKAEDGMTVGFEERITVGFDESVTVFVTALDNATVTAEDGVTVPDDTATMLLPVVVTEKLLNDEMATASAGLAEETWATTTAAVFAPLTIETAPEETDVMVGLEERMTVGLEESVTVPDDTATMLLPAVVTVKFENDEIATTRAGDAEDTIAVTTPAVFAPLMMETAPDDTEVMVGFEDNITVGFDDRATVLVTALESATVTADDGVIVPEETATMLDPAAETVKLENELMATTSAGLAEDT